MSTTEARPTAPALSTVTVPVTLTEQRDGGGLKLSGLAIPYSVSSEFIGFTEQISPGAFRDSLGGSSDLLLLWQHDTAQPLAREKAGNLEVRDSSRGIEFSATLPDTTLARDALTLVRSGVVTQMSFAFTVSKDHWEQRGGQNVRIVDKGKLREISLVTSPAYSQTDVAARNRLTSGINEAVKRQRWERITARTVCAYQPDGPYSYFRDIITLATANRNRNEVALRGPGAGDERFFGGHHFVHGSAAEARERLGTIERRATNTTASTAGGGFVPTGPPAYLGAEFADAARSVGVLPRVMRVEPLAPVGMVVKEPRLTTGVSVGVQAAELDPASSTALVEALESDPVITISSYNDVSRQLLDRTDPGIDAVIAREAGRAWAAKLDSQILTGAGSAGEMSGLLVVAGTTAESYTDASSTQAEAWPALMKLYSDVATTFGVEPDLVLLHPRRLAWFYNWKDSAGAQVEINWPEGLTVQTVPSMPTTRGAGTNEDAVIFLRRSEVPLHLAPPQFMVDRFTLSHQHEARIVVYSYAALASSRQPAAVGILTGTGLSAPVFA